MKNITETSIHSENILSADIDDNTNYEVPVIEATMNPDKVLDELAKLSRIQYETVRKDEAKKLGVSLSTLDNLVKDARKNNNGENNLIFEEITPWHEPVNPEELLLGITETIQRFIVCEPETAMAAALWTAMTWFMDVVQVAPIAVITAPEKRCGKTQLLSLLSKISYRPLPSSSISPAALYRAIEKWQLTLLIDEADTFIKNNEELRGLFNAGHTRDSAFTLRCVGDNHEPTKFNLWGAKALSGIGKLADTIMDRAIVLELRRKLPTERVERLRYAPTGMFETLQKKLARFAEDYREVIKNARPHLPDVLNDRAQDNWEPLLMIADTAGSDYSRIAREAAITLSGNNEGELSLNVQLLADIYEVFETIDADRIFTDKLIKALCENDGTQWAEYNSYSV